MGKKKGRQSKKAKNAKQKELLLNIRKETTKQNRKSKKQIRKFKRQRKGEAYDSDWNKFCDQLRKMGLMIRNSKPDGNCLFRSLSDQLEGSEHYHAKYRKEIVDHMQDFREQYEPFHVGDYDKHLRSMGKNGTWGGNIELTAASRVYKIDIVVHQLGAARYEILYQLGKPERSIHVSYHDERHYASVRKIDDTKGNAPAQCIELSSKEEQMEREQQRQAIASWFSQDYGEGGEEEDEFLDFPSTNEQLIMDVSNCQDLQHIREVMALNNEDMDASIAYLLMEFEELGFHPSSQVSNEIEGATEPDTLQSVSNTHTSQNGSNKKRKKKKKSKKGKKKKKNANAEKIEEKTEKTEEDTKEDEKKEETANGSNKKRRGKGKCPCGSGRKARKCCKSRHVRRMEHEKAQKRNNDSDSDNDARRQQFMSRKDELMAKIEDAEKQINEIKGKKQKKILRKELEKLKEIHRNMELPKDEDSDRDNEGEGGGGGTDLSSFTIAV